jgi:hypothetical protein
MACGTTVDRFNFAGRAYHGRDGRGLPAPDAGGVIDNGSTRRAAASSAGRGWRRGMQTSGAVRFRAATDLPPLWRRCRHSTSTCRAAPLGSLGGGHYPLVELGDHHQHVRRRDRPLPVLANPMPGDSRYPTTPSISGRGLKAVPSFICTTTQFGQTVRRMMIIIA